MGGGLRDGGDGEGNKATESRSVYPGTCTVWSAESKIGFYYLCWVLGGVSLICGVNAFCQLKREPAWRVTRHFSLGESLMILQEGIRQEKKRQTHRINVISDGETSCLAKSNSLLEKPVLFFF